MAQAFTALTVSPGAGALYDQQRAAKVEHNPHSARSPTASSASSTDA